jgi:hypothetical protein
MRSRTPSPTKFSSDRSDSDKRSFSADKKSPGKSVADEADEAVDWGNCFDLSLVLTDIK